MRPFTLLTAALATLQFQDTAAVDVEKTVMITYQKTAPAVDNLINQAVEAIEKAGGRITHRFDLIKGFSAKASQEVIESIQAWGGSYVTVEIDQPVSISKPKAH